MYPVIGISINIFRPQLSDHGPMKRLNMMGGITFTVSVSVCMLAYVWKVHKGISNHSMLSSDFV